NRLIFTSGATEANNLALLGHARTHGGGHLISVRTEHHAVLDPLAQLQREGFQISLLTPQPSGLITPAQLEEAIRPDTRLVSVMAANNEIGVLQPLKELAEICRNRGVVFHSDAAQAFGHIALEPDNLGLDLVSLSAHKLYGPKGIGALVIREGLALERMKQSRPKDLQVLLEEPDAGGPRIIGIYGIKPGGVDGTLRSYSLWEESPSDLNVYVESVNCDVDTPLRVKRTLSAVFVRHLNPGGPILEGNREDHLVWWAACVPEVAGTDPATLRNKALELGFSTLLSERQEQLPALAP
ncbi:aminotransferase class V-fold PLP-dependent enzyme, partial [Synechococcus sp. AH-601-P06]|nr:aminotransferase class V-fold PLP-dependent enzyme [Synechococcus sp. AH-601-P06]